MGRDEERLTLTGLLTLGLCGGFLQPFRVSGFISLVDEAPGH